jgi:cytoskeletal protein CcmA (bactofilin family)
MDAPQTKDLAHIGKSVVVKGEVSGSEDLYVDGVVEGSIDLRNHSVTVGPNGKVKASIIAKSITISGKVDGSVTASDRLDLRKSAMVTGDVTTQRIAIEEGAFLKGKVDIQKEVGKGTASS